jgi:hypothetical protein
MTGAAVDFSLLLVTSEEPGETGAILVGVPLGPLPTGDPAAGLKLPKSGAEAVELSDVIVKAKEQTAQQNKPEEDAEYRGSAKRQLAFVLIKLVFVVIKQRIHGNKLNIQGSNA